MSQCKVLRCVAVVSISCALFLHISQRAEAANICGDKIASNTERCDGADFKKVTCKELSYKDAQGKVQKYIGGTLLCTNKCGIDLSKCKKAPAIVANPCGNGDIDAGEQCDWKGLGGATCQSLGFEGGKLGCNGYLCKFNTNGCYKCGDGKLDATEQCDGANVQNTTCNKLLGGGFAGNIDVTCTAQCAFDVSQCTGSAPDIYSPPLQPPAALQLPVCGNWKLDAGEVCDTKQVATKVNKTLCTDLGYWGGTATCKLDCTGYGEGSCQGWGSDSYGIPQSPNYVPGCGNGYLDVGEVCDPENPGTNSKSCKDLGYYGFLSYPTPLCKSDCSGYPEVNCYGWGNDPSGAPLSPNYQPGCGNGSLDSGESCDPKHPQTKSAPNTELCKTLGYFEDNGGLCNNSCSGFGEMKCIGWGDDPYGKPPTKSAQ